MASLRDDTKVPESELRADYSSELLERLITTVATGRERIFLEAKAHGERRTSVLGEILGVGGLSAGEQRRTVKRVADKLLQRLRRLVKSA